jgi:PAS domain-containing protein
MRSRLSPGFCSICRSTIARRRPNDVPQRRAAIKGFVYVALHAENLFVAAMVEELKGMRVQVFDGTRADPSKLLFATTQAASPDGITARKIINAAGRTWLLELQAGDRFVSAQRQEHALVVALAALCAVLLFGVMLFITRTRDHAQAIARRMTAELQGKRAELEHVQDSSPVGVYVLSRDGSRVTYANAKACEITGTDPQQSGRIPLGRATASRGPR